MKLAVFSDAHIHAFAEFGANERLEDGLSIIGDIREHCIANGIDAIAFGGDLFHKRGIVYTKPYSRVALELRKIKKAGIDFYACVGNHDMEDADGEVDALQPLIAGQLVKGVGRKGFRVVQLKDCSLTLFSYCDSADELAKRIKLSLKERKGEKHIALFHHGFKGARVGSTLEYEVKEPIDGKALRLDRRFDLVLSGHYHAHQQIEGVRNGWYVGSPLEHTRSDRSEDRKGFLVLDTRRMDFVRVALKRPRFVTVNVGEALDDVQGNFVDVVYAKADASLDEFLDSVKQAGARGVKPVPLPSAKTQTKQRLKVSPELAPKKVLKRFVKHRKKDLKKQGLDSRAVFALGLQLLRSSQE